MCEGAEPKSLCQVHCDSPCNMSESSVLSRYWASPTTPTGSWLALFVSAYMLKPLPLYSNYCWACMMKQPLHRPHSSCCSAWLSSSCPALCMWGSWSCWTSPLRLLRYAQPKNGVLNESACIQIQDMRTLHVHGAVHCDSQLLKPPGRAASDALSGITGKT